MIEAYATGFPIRISTYGTAASAGGDNQVVGFSRPWAHAGVALPGELVEPRFQRAHAFGDQAPVGLQLGLAGTSQADAALLPLQVGPASDQAARQVGQLRQFHLQLALEAASPLSKNI